MKRLDKEISENILANSNENITDNSEQDICLSSSMNIPTSEVKAEVKSNQDENSNFAENTIVDIATTADFDQNNPKEHSNTTAESVNSNTTFAENWNSENKDIISNKENERTCEDTSTTLNTQNINLPQESLPLSYIYKKNNERSNLQDFLREEAIKKTTTIMNIGTKQLTSLDTCLNNTVTLTNDDITKKIIGAIQRPKSLPIERIDNMTAAQANKFKVLMQEYGTTPNNNEFNTTFSNKGEIIDRMNINDNNKILIDTTNGDTTTVSMKENVNNNVLPSTNAGSPNETVRGFIDNEKCSNEIDNTDNKAQESALNNAQQQNNIDTPMSCTTDNLTTLSIHTPSSQIPNSDDIFTLNAGQEISSLSDTEKSITERTYLESPMSNFKLPSLFGVSPDTKSSIMSSFLTIADVEMIDHTSLQVYLQKSVIIPLQIQTRLINHAVIKYLLNEHNMFSHLHSLRSYFFLLNGEFAKNLTDSLYSRLYTISAPIELFNSATLTNLLEKALMNSFSNNYANAELLSLSAIDKPCQLYVSKT